MHACKANHLTFGFVHCRDKGLHLQVVERIIYIMWFMIRVLIYKTQKETEINMKQIAKALNKHRAAFIKQT